MAFDHELEKAFLSKKTISRGVSEKAGDQKNTIVVKTIRDDGLDRLEGGRFDVTSSNDCCCAAVQLFGGR